MSFIPTMRLQYVTFNLQPIYKVCYANIHILVTILFPSYKNTDMVCWNKPDRVKRYRQTEHRDIVSEMNCCVPWPDVRCLSLVS